jgi:hypothetical protein
MEPERTVARQRLSEHVQTNKQQEERCSVCVLAATVARQQNQRANILPW